MRARSMLEEKGCTILCNELPCIHLKPVHELTVMSAMLIISLMQGGEKVFF